MSMSGMKLPKPSIQPSGAVPPGLSSPQDFPPLAAPQPVAAPKLQKKVTGSNLVLGVIKPIVPVLPSRTLAPTKENRETLIAQKLEDTSAPCSTEHERVIEATVARPIAKPKLKAKQSAIGSSRKNAQSKNGSSEVLLQILRQQSLSLSRSQSRKILKNSRRSGLIRAN